MLYLVENNDGFSSRQRGAISGLKDQKDIIKIGQVIKQFFRLTRGLVKVYEYVRLILIARKLLNNG